MTFRCCYVSFFLVNEIYYGNVLYEIDLVQIHNAAHTVFNFKWHNNVLLFINTAQLIHIWYFVSKNKYYLTKNQNRQYNNCFRPLYVIGPPTVLLKNRLFLVCWIWHLNIPLFTGIDFNPVHVAATRSYLFRYISMNESLFKCVYTRTEIIIFFLKGIGKIYLYKIQLDVTGPRHT